MPAKHVQSLLCQFPVRWFSLPPRTFVPDVHAHVALDLENTGPAFHSAARGLRTSSDPVERPKSPRRFSSFDQTIRFSKSDSAFADRVSFRLPPSGPATFQLSFMHIIIRCPTVQVKLFPQFSQTENHQPSCRFPLRANFPLPFYLRKNPGRRAPQ